MATTTATKAAAPVARSAAPSPAQAAPAARTEAYSVSLSPEALAASASSGPTNTEMVYNASGAITDLSGAAMGTSGASDMPDFQLQILSDVADIEAMLDGGLEATLNSLLDSDPA